jgi:hypothetical protein
MHRQRLRSFSPWPSAALPIGLEIDLFIALSLLIGTGVAFLLEWRYARRRAGVPPPERIRAVVREAKER